MQTLSRLQNQLLLCRWQTRSGEEVDSICRIVVGEPRLTHYRQFGSMAEKVADFEMLLKDVSLRVGEEDAATIRTLLEQVRATS